MDDKKDGETPLVNAVLNNDLTTLTNVIRDILHQQYSNATK